MRRIVLLLAFTCVASSIFGSLAVYACSYGPGPFFGTPTYIDPDLSRSDRSYDRRRNFYFLIEPYVKLVLHRELYVDEKLVNDNGYRKAGATYEPTAYELYQKSADFFNEYEFPQSLDLFKQSLEATDSNSIWVREASTYMIARTLLCMSQNDWDGYSDDSHQIFQDVVDSANKAYQSYLKLYPKGLYVESATEIKRRIFYLRGNVDSLDYALKLMMSRALDTSHVDTGKHRITRAAMQEVYAHLSGRADFRIDHPFVIGLSLLSEGDPTDEDIEQLLSRKSDFDDFPGIYNYLYALGLYRIGRYEEILESTHFYSDSVSPFTVSTLLLRARSFSKLNQDSASLATLVLMHRHQRDIYLDSELAIQAKKLGRLEWLFTKDGPPLSNSVLSFCAAFGFSDSEIESALQKIDIVDSKRQFLARELALRYLFTSRYGECAQLLDRERFVDYDSVRLFARSLSLDPKNVEALAGLGEFLSSHHEGPLASLNFSQIIQLTELGLAEANRRCETCFAVEVNRANYLAPIDLFRKVVEISRQRGKRSEAEAKSLHFIVLARKPGKEYSITWKYLYGYNLTKDECKAAFQRLHRLYKDSKWAKATPYYYN